MKSICHILLVIRLWANDYCFRHRVYREPKLTRFSIGCPQCRAEIKAREVEREQQRKRKRAVLDWRYRGIPEQFWKQLED